MGTPVDPYQYRELIGVFPKTPELLQQLRLWQPVKENHVVDQNEIQFEDDVITEEQFKQLTERQVLPAGQYRFRVKNVSRALPESERAGGDKVSFEVVVPPTGAQMPEGGWKPTTRLFKKYLNPSPGQVKSEFIDKQGKAELVKACGLQITGSANLYQLLKSCEGREVIASVTLRENNGRTYMDIGSFRPV